MAKCNRSRLRALWLCAATAVSAPVLAADKPSDEAGARQIADFLAAYLGKAALPSVKVTQDGAGYHVSFDIGGATSAMKSTGIVYDPATLQFKVFQQSDGEWRVEAEPPPPITGHITPPPGQPNSVKLDVRSETTNLKSVTLIDPALNWVASFNGSIDKINVVESGPGVEETFDVTGLKFDGKTTNGPTGLATTAHEPIDAMHFAVDIDRKGVNLTTHRPEKPVHVSGQGQGGNGDISLSQFQPQPLLDAWRFLVAHPERADVARDFDKLKPVATALAADHLKLEEMGALDKLDVMTEYGNIALEGVSIGVGVANMGPSTGGFERFAARSIKLPDGLAPPMYGPLIPASFNFGVKATGFDVEAATQEWLADAKLDGDAPALSKEDQAKVTDKLIGGRPILIEIEPSRIKGPSLDVSFEGKITLEHNERTGAMKVTLRDFTKTVEAIQTLPPQLAQQATPVIGMAKGLATQEPDGSMVWVFTIGHDHMVKVNGLPLTKAPF